MNLAPQAMLLVRGGPEEGTTVQLREGMMIMGRSAVSDMVVDSPGVSRQHAAIRGDRDGYWLMDLGSRNGTFVNGDQIGQEPVRLSNWDRVELGGMETHWVFMESQDTVEVQRPPIG
jgi:pSer/pThr/pTyr-binding forkhead associated (FHA) protein